VVVARGEESDLPYVLVHLGAIALLSGDLAEAHARGEETVRVAELTGQGLFIGYGLFVRGLTRVDLGRGEEAEADLSESLALSERAGWPIGIGQARWALGRLALVRGDQGGAVEVMDPVVATVEAAGVYEWPVAMCLPDAVEAMVGAGDLARAARLEGALAEWGRRFDRPWCLATAGRLRALIAAAEGDLEGAAAAAGAALAAHERLPMPIELGRTLTVLGGVQRRRRRRAEARAVLAEAVARLEACGARPWADRARAELGRLRTRRATPGLSESERRIAELAAAGRTNAEIAAELFVSRRTVEATLSRAYRKLGVRSRAELGVRLADEEGRGAA
jgi:DNA-binding CsgD family transcriptional regulator